MTDAPQTQPVRNGVAIRCLPDRGVVRAEMGADGTPRLRIPGQMEVKAFADPILRAAYPEVWHAPGRSMTIPTGVEAVANLITSVEDCAQSLADLDDALLPGLPVLNHPRAVALTRRDMAEGVFSPIPGLAVPRMRRLVADGPGAFQQAFAAGGFRFPVRIEPVWDDGDNSPHLIARPGDLQKVFVRPWGRRPFVMVQAEETEVPWRLMLGMVGKFGHAEIFNTVDSGLPALPPRVDTEITHYIRHLMAGVLRCLPLDCWTLEVALAEGRPRFERLVVGPPVVVATDRPTPRHAAAAKLRKVMEPPLHNLLANSGLWRADAAHAPTVAHTLALHPVATQGARPQ